MCTTRKSQELMHTFPTTRPNVEAGTPQMAYEIARLFRETELARQKLLVMAGHRDGVFAFGTSCVEVLEVFQRHYARLGLA
jgi:hypothetical protein